jgi:hypothetical protein
MPYINDAKASELLKEQTNAIIALRGAISYLAYAAPSVRDYQDAPPGTFDLVHDEHRSRLERLESVMTELESLAEYISDQC